MKFKVSYDGILPKSVMLDEVEYVRDDVVTQLRAELSAERELVDRLYSAIEYIDDYCLAYPELEAVSAVSSSAIDYVDTRRNK